MMNVFDKRAKALSDYVEKTEADSDRVFEKDFINRCIAHGRMDLVLMSSYLGDSVLQLRTIKWALIVCAICLVIIAFKV